MGVGWGDKKKQQQTLETKSNPRCFTTSAGARIGKASFVTKAVTVPSGNMGTRMCKKISTSDQVSLAFSCKPDRGMLSRREHLVGSLSPLTLL